MRSEIDQVEVSVVMPCLNEARTIGICVAKAREALKAMGVSGEILVVDNGSTDDSTAIAIRQGATVLHQPKRGYGNAYLLGLGQARGRFIVMADSDNTYDLGDLRRFIEPLRNGADMVMGSRFKGDIKKGAMPWKNRYIGNPVLSGFLRLLFGTSVSDAHCGMRSLTKEAFERMNLKSPGMEFASEMVIHAAKAKLKITEIPISLYPNKDRKPHLRPFSDGWRHLRFMLLYSPDVVLLVPGVLLTMLGLAILIAVSLDAGQLGVFLPGPNTMMLGSFFIVLGLQGIMFNLLVKNYYARSHPLFEIGRATKKISAFLSLERGSALGVASILTGIGVYGIVGWRWFQKGLGELTFQETKVSLWALTLLIVGVQIIFTAFALSIIKGTEEA